MATLGALLDANALFPFSLRDTLMRCAAAGLFRVHWSAQILEEARRSLIRSGAITEPQAEHLLQTMMQAFPEALVTDYEPLIPEMKTHADDRHVAAAALRAGAQVIVTRNLRHFQELPADIEAQDPDAFLCALLELDPSAVVRIVHAQAAALRKPPRSFDQLVAGLAKIVPEFARNVRDGARSS